MTKQFDKALHLAGFDKIFAGLRASDTRVLPKFTDIQKPPRRVAPLIYLPVEVKARELEAKVIIARDMLASGFNVVIGAAWLISYLALRLPPGIMLTKTLNANDAKNMEAWVRHGHLIAATDEEAFGIAAARDFIEATTHPHAAALADMVCAQGVAYARAYPYPGDIRISGNPRTLTYAPSQGDDILVCLQSGNINPAGKSFVSLVKTTLMLSAYPLTSPQGAAWAEILRSSIAHECDALPLVMGTIEALAQAFPNRTIKVRPHPIEDLATWAFNRPNIILDTSSSIIEAMRTAGALVYVSGCTTGLDAHLAGIPAVRLGSGGHGISARMHTQADTPGEAVAAVRQAVRWNGNLEDHLAPVSLVAHLRALYEKNAGGPVSLSDVTAGAEEVMRIVNFAPEDFHRRKFPDMSAADMSALIGRPATPLAWNTFLL